MAKSFITQTLGGPSHGVLGLIEISHKIARLSEAGYAFETKRRELEHQFDVTNSELREEYLAALATTGEALGESIDLIVVATGKREQLSDEFFPPSGAPRRDLLLFGITVKSLLSRLLKPTRS